MDDVVTVAPQRLLLQLVHDPMTDSELSTHTDMCWTKQLKETKLKLN